MSKLKPVCLGQGTPYLDSDQAIRKFVIKAINDNKVDKYTDSQGVLGIRELISKKLKEEGMEYNPEEIVLTTGALETIHCIFLSLQKYKNPEVLIPVPTYFRYFELAKLAGVNLIPVPLNEEKNWDLDIDLLKQKITPNTKAILICSPNNPTGNIIPKDKILEVCKLAKSKNIKVIMDDIYSTFCFEGKLFNPATKSEFKDTIIRVVSFSKTYSLTGWRIGYVHSDIKNIQPIFDMHSTISICAPAVSQYAGMGALLSGERIAKETFEIYKMNRTLMGDCLEKMPQLEVAWPQGGYYFFPKIKGLKNDVIFCRELKRQQNLTVSPGSSFGSGGEGHVRICFGKSESDIKEGMKRLANFLKDFKN
ncbi:MAG: pyridoxal phosphate-dependent aminotransferase [Microgenomates group bacterium]|jgi:aminotransferase